MEKTVESAIQELNENNFLLTLKVDNELITAGAFTTKEDAQTALNVCYTLCKKVYDAELVG